VVKNVVNLVFGPLADYDEEALMEKMTQDFFAQIYLADTSK